MEIRQLIAFKRVLELQSYTKAAESLSLTQPSISHQLRLLEEEIGEKLFEMKGRKATLTLTGKTFLPYVERILADIDESKRIMEHVQGGGRSLITIAAIGSSTVYLLPDLIYQFQMENPQIEIILRNEGADEILDLVKQNQVDIGIVGSHVPLTDFVSIPLFKDKIGPFVHSKHPLAKKRNITFTQLAQEPLIQLGTWKSWQNYVLSIFRQVEVTPQIRLQLDSIDAVKRMVEKGFGFTIIPHIAAREEMKDGRLVALAPTDIPPLTRQVLLVHRKQKIFSKAQQNFINFLQKEIPNFIKTKGP